MGNDLSCCAAGRDSNDTEDGFSWWVADNSRSEIDSDGLVFASPARRELAIVNGAAVPMRYHSLVAECGGQITRYREVIQYHAARILPEFLIAYRRE